jgi:hypothetical protein
VGVSSLSLQAYCYLTATVPDHPPTLEEIDSAMQAKGLSLAKVAEGTMTLGGKTFLFLEYRPTLSTNPEDSSARVRIYNAGIGPDLFSSVFNYRSTNAAEALADMEAALATLSLSGTPIRARPFPARPGLSSAARDILGRSGPREARSTLPCGR